MVSYFIQGVLIPYYHCLLLCLNHPKCGQWEPFFSQSLSFAMSCYFCSLPISGSRRSSCTFLPQPRIWCIPQKPRLLMVEDDIERPKSEHQECSALMGAQVSRLLGGHSREVHTHARTHLHLYFYLLPTVDILKTMNSDQFL